MTIFGYGNLWSPVVVARERRRSTGGQEKLSPAGHSCACVREGVHALACGLVGVWVICAICVSVVMLFLCCVCAVLYCVVSWRCVVLNGRVFIFFVRFGFGLLWFRVISFAPVSVFLLFYLVCV